MKSLEKKYHVIGRMAAVLFGVAMLVLGNGSKAYAVEFTTSEATAVLQTTEQTPFYQQPDGTAAPVTVTDAGILVPVSGITSNGWYRVEAGGTFYVPGTKLIPVGDAGQADVTNQNAAVNPTTQIPRQERFEAQVNTVEETKAAVQKGIQSHAGLIVLKGSGASFHTVGNMIQEVLYSPMNDYEGATIHGMQMRGSRNTCEVQLMRMSTVEEENAVDAAVAQLVPQFSQGSTKDRVIAVHDFICSQITYSDETVAGLADFRSAYDGLASGQGVCTSYALLFQKFMDQMGIPCYVASGTVRGTGHAWNIVNVDGSWYHMDCTWADQPWGISYRWCLNGADKAGYSSWGGIALAPVSLEK